MGFIHKNAESAMIETENYVLNIWDPQSQSRIKILRYSSNNWILSGNLTVAMEKTTYS